MPARGLRTTGIVPSGLRRKGGGTVAAVRNPGGGGGATRGMEAPGNPG